MRDHSGRRGWEAGTGDRIRRPELGTGARKTRAGGRSVRSGRKTKWEGGARQRGCDRSGRHEHEEKAEA